MKIKSLMAILWEYAPLSLMFTVVNSLRPSDAFVRQYNIPTLLHIMTRHLVTWWVPSHYLNQCGNIVNWTLRNKLQWNFNQNSYIFIQQNAFEKVICEIVAILSGPQCVNSIMMRVSFAWQGVMYHVLRTVCAGPIYMYTGTKPHLHCGYATWPSARQSVATILTNQHPSCCLHIFGENQWLE